MDICDLELSKGLYSNRKQREGVFCDLTEDRSFALYSLPPPAHQTNLLLSFFPSPSPASLSLYLSLLQFPIPGEASDTISLHQKLDKMMHMTFYWGIKVTLLFDSWKTESWTSYALTLLACFLFSVFYQYMEDRRLRFKVFATGKKPTTIPSIDTPLLIPRLPGCGWSTLARYAAAILFGVNSALGYLLMLAVMSFNGGVFLAIVLGLAFGYLIFRINDEELVLVENPCACA